MKKINRVRIWSYVEVVALALTAVVISDRTLAKRAIVNESLRDAVASPAVPATVVLADKPAHVSWFKTPTQKRAEMTAMLLSSRGRRAFLDRVVTR